MIRAPEKITLPALVAAVERLDSTLQRTVRSLERCAAHVDELESRARRGRVGVAEAPSSGTGPGPADPEPPEEDELDWEEPLRRLARRFANAGSGPPPLPAEPPRPLRR
jgi:hypothetical protein